MKPLHAPLLCMPSIPVGEKHPGSFGYVRRHDVHTGIDLYAPVGSPVFAMEEGKVIEKAWFTGEKIGMSWWENTRAVYIEGESGVFNYGEIVEHHTLKVGDTVSRGEFIGHVVQVLKNYKGRPMSMLHLELYDHGYIDDWGPWEVGQPKPEHLKNPTDLILERVDGAKPCMVDHYQEICKLVGKGE